MFLDVEAVVCLPGGVQPPRGEPGPDGGRGDQRAARAGQSGDGEVPAEQRALQQPEERPGKGAGLPSLPPIGSAVFTVNGLSGCVCVSQVCCCCRVKFPLFSWPSTCLLCKRYRSLKRLQLTSEHPHTESHQSKDSVSLSASGLTIRVSHSSSSHETC